MSHLIAFINSHDGCRAESILPGGREIEVSSLVVLPSGKVERVTERIEASMAAVRRWLGY